jgi:uncharacterized protein (DUF2252 family)
MLTTLERMAVITRSASPSTPPKTPLQVTRAARIQAGRDARKQVSRKALGVWQPGRDRVDPISILEKQAETRVPQLVPIRYGRMAASKFAFFRGGPAIMASDLAAYPNTGLTVQLCGDAHLSNFGLFASPERRLVFDLNDFDETLPGPFEWDVKRLTASVAVAARGNGFSDSYAESVVRDTARSYRLMMRRLATLGELDVWYEHIDSADLLRLAKRPRGRRDLKRAISSAESHTSVQALRKLTKTGADGVPHIHHQPPLLVPAGHLDEETARRVFTDYRSTLQEDRRVLLERHRFAEIAMKVVGVGSVGTRCFVVLLLGETVGAPLFLQIKEAEQSVLAPYLHASRFQHQGHRVVNGQRLMQAASDIFLGWATGPEGRFFYLRQLRDMKGSATIEQMSKRELRSYAEVCGHTLARAHARGGDRLAIAAYLGEGDAFDRAMAEWAIAYADQTNADHDELTVAIASGRVQAEAG